MPRTYTVKIYDGKTVWMKEILGYRATAHDVYTETGSDFALASIFYYLKRNRLSQKGLREFLCFGIDFTAY